jgi:hypothetical protein
MPGVGNSPFLHVPAGHGGAAADSAVKGQAHRWWGISESIISRGRSSHEDLGKGAGDNSWIELSDAMTIALLIALAGSLALMAFIVKKLEKAA